MKNCQSIGIIWLFIMLAVSSYSQTNHLCQIAKLRSFSRNLSLEKLKYPGDKNIDVTYYKLDLNVSYSPTNISGVVTIHAKSLVDDLSEIFIDLRDNMIVDSIQTDNISLNFNHHNNLIDIFFPDPVSIDQLFSINIFYHGVPELFDPRYSYGFTFGEHNGQPEVWTFSQPYGSYYWWPCKDTPGDKADSSDFWITSSTFFKPVSNGILEEIIDQGDGTHTYKWKNHYPIATYLISFSMTNYEEYVTHYNYSPSDSMPVIHYLYPEKIDSLRPYVDRTVDAIELFSDLFGEYPFIKEKYGHTQVNKPMGMEHQTVATMSGFHTRWIVHELAHQWFGDKITCKDWHHIWLNEGFATYAELIYEEVVNGKEAYDASLETLMMYAKNAEGTIYVQNIDSSDEIFDFSRSYAKGAVVLHMLRGIVGDSVFFKILRTYAESPDLVYGVAVTEDFQQVSESLHGTDLDYFFDEWIYGEQYPTYEVNWDYNELSIDSFMVNILISQEQKNNPSYFVMPVQLKITTEKGDTLITVFNDQQIQNFTFSVNGRPEKLSLDPNNLILKNVRYISFSISSFCLKQNYPNPFNSLTKIQFEIPKSSFVTIKIYNLLGKECETLISKRLTGGEYKIDWVANDFASGIYFCRMVAGEFTQTKKLILQR